MAQDRAGEIRHALAQTTLFGALDDQQLDRLITCGVTTSFSTRKTIFQKNDPGDSLMVVLRGRIKVSNMSLDGREVVLTFVTPGAVLGEIALLDARPRSADATASEPTDVFLLRRRDLLPLLREHPDIAIRLIEVLCAKLRTTTEQLEASMFLTLAPRLARVLLRLADDHGQPEGKAVRIAVKISQREIAGLVGSARENVNRQLCAWREEGLVRVEQGCITLLDPARLRDITEEAV